MHMTEQEKSEKFVETVRKLEEMFDELKDTDDPIMASLAAPIGVIIACSKEGDPEGLLKLKDHIMNFAIERRNVLRKKIDERKKKEANSPDGKTLH